MTRDERFDEILEAEGDGEPVGERSGYGKTLPFVKARAPLEEIYRLSVEAEKPAQQVLKAARAGADELAAALRALDGKPHRGFALLYAAQKAGPLVAEDPRNALALAKAVRDEAASLMEACRETRVAAPAPRQAVQAEAYLLESQALNMMGDAAGAGEAAVAARPLFAEAGDLGFGAALCDYFEGEAATFQREYAKAESLIRRAVTIFEEFGQDHLLAKAEAAIGTVLGNRGEFAEGVERLDHAISLFDPDVDARALTAALGNRAGFLAQMSRFDEARASYARAMTIARRKDLSAQMRYIRTGLAELDFLRGQYARALRAFREIASESAVNGSAMDVLFSRLYIAECLGRTGQSDAMSTEIEAIRAARRQSVFAPSPALGELFVCLDQGSLDADLVAHVREYLEAVENGNERPYMPLRMVG